jgi:WD40 repeat protein
VALWSVARGERLRVLEGHNDSVWSVAFSPDGALLASASNDRTGALWSVERGERLRLLEGHSAPVWSVAFSPDGATLATASHDGTVRLWEAAKGLCLATLFGLSAGWVAFRPDGRYKFQGSVGGAFWHTNGLCRFEVGELDAYLPLRIPEGEPLLQDSSAHGR